MIAEPTSGALGVGTAWCTQCLPSAWHRRSGGAVNINDYYLSLQLLTGFAICLWCPGLLACLIRHSSFWRPHEFCVSLYIKLDSLLIGDSDTGAECMVLAWWAFVLFSLGTEISTSVFYARRGLWLPVWVLTQRPGVLVLLPVLALRRVSLKPRVLPGREDPCSAGHAGQLGLF